jgi:hypothetical protein
MAAYTGRKIALRLQLPLDIPPSSTWAMTPNPASQSSQTPLPEIHSKEATGRHPTSRPDQKHRRRPMPAIAQSRKHFPAPENCRTAP